MAGVVLAVSLTACASESTSTTSFNVTTTTDEGTTEYNYSSEFANGEAFAYAVFSLTVENGKFATVDEAYIVDSIDEI